MCPGYQLKSRNFCQGGVQGYQLKYRDLCQHVKGSALTRLASMNSLGGPYSGVRSFIAKFSALQYFV